MNQLTKDILKINIFFAYNLIHCLKQTNTSIIEKNINYNDPRLLYYNDKVSLNWFKKYKIEDVSLMFNEQNEFLTRDDLEKKLNLIISKNKYNEYKSSI